jgi:hypothetical protein
MCKTTITEAQRQLLEIITRVESDDVTPQEASTQLTTLKEFAPEEFKADYTVADFQRIQTNALGSYQSSTGETVEPEFEPSYESSY